MNERAALNQLALVLPGLFTEQRVRRRAGGRRGRDAPRVPSRNPELCAAREGSGKGTE